ncbi:MAG: Hsp20/alpha crystallin family protein [Deinococcales bacterium]|nr:Hsp20/alpha crystallin family protein [Chitinophagaceae bacterium]
MTFVKKHPSNINYLFDEIINGFPANWGKDQFQNTFAPAANIHETKDGFHVELNVPGRNKEDFKVTIENGLLTIAFEQKEVAENNDYKTLRREFSFKSFKRSFSIDEKINAEGVQAKYDNGILKLLLPKKEEVKIAPKEIAIL